ncbi:cytochrome b/b6 domain-containing protein [Erythrobacter sp. Alg231-14]|uniref:cytochrome b/b6 domain-containing protein n=1 Tax=Erythrobacter sp. Alg231-14 TaxID=1922225 RepID=UPI000D5596B3
MATNTQRVNIWDAPVRVTHWSLALIVPAMWFTADNSMWYWHTRLGHVLLALLIFRVFWGFMGTDTARFGSFVRGPRSVLSYLRGDGDAPRAIGHSPLGALAVIGLLSVIGAQVVMGLFAGDPFDGATGPLNGMVGVATADWITETHEWFVYVVAGMIALHLAAITVYVGVKKQSLIAPMIAGKGPVSDGVAGNSNASWSRFLICAAGAIGVAVWVWFGAPPMAS